MPAKKKSSGAGSSSGTNKKSASQKNKRSGRQKSMHGKKSSNTRRVLFRNWLFWLFLAVLTLFIIYIAILDQRITQRFEGRIWQLPAHVYARPLELFVGKAISVEQLKFELEYLNYQQVDILPGEIAQYRQVDNTFEIKTRKFVFWDGDERSHTIRVAIEDNRVVDLLDIYKSQQEDLVRFDAGYLTGIFPAHAEDRVLLKLDDVPDIFIKMLLLIEDRRFFTHYGVDPLSIGRALVVNITSGQTVQGGSTLTQQLVKNLFLNQEKKLSRKINEAFMSLLLELHYDKRLILETYLNEIYLGQDGRRSIHGFGLASDFYFGKPLKDLSIDQMAIMIAMVKGASYYNPIRNPENARKRRDVVLTTMQQEELITDRQLQTFLAKPVSTVKHAQAGLYPAFIDAVKEQLQQDYQAEDLRSEGLRVFTTLDPYVQYKTEQVIKSSLPKLSSDTDLQAAAVVVSPLNGDVLAVVGDRNPGYKGFNRALNASRQVGSLIKPVVYLSALEKSGYTLATMLDDSPLLYQSPGQDDWQPLNYDKQFHGDVTLYESLLKSYNVPVVRTALDVGLDNVIQTLADLGVRKSMSNYPSLALGAISLSPMEIASIYQSFAANGFHSPLRSVFAVLDKNSKPLERYSLDVSNKVDSDSVTIINSALIDVTRYGTAKRLGNTLDIQVAGKTGTSDDLRDSWFAGFSGNYIGVVWAGYDDNRPANLTGSSGAMRIWQNLFAEIAYTDYQLPQSPSIQAHWIDLETGQLSGQGCENAVELLFVEGTQPDQSSDCTESGGSNWFLDLFK